MLIVMTYDDEFLQIFKINSKYYWYNRFFFLFFTVAMHLLKNGEKQDESNTNNVRQKALVLLCRMQPSKTLLIRNRCIEMCKMPSLALGNRNQKNLKNIAIRAQASTDSDITSSSNNYFSLIICSINFGATSSSE